MSRHEIRIERLAIRLHGGDAGEARNLGASIGREALRQIAEQINVPRGRRVSRITQIDAGTLRLESSSTASGAIAGQIARTINSKLAPRTKRK